ncbi:MAG: formylglycine-generating enzyme family protein [bacterium]|nr:formylglycine-generating enzyme family protein [bacterium]
MQFGEWIRLCFILVLVSTFIVTIPKVALGQSDPVADYIANYFGMLNNYGDASLPLSDRQLIREEILTNFFLFEDSIVWNDLRPQGSRYIESREYLNNMLADFPEGISFSHKFIEIGDLQPSEDGLETIVRLQVRAAPYGQRSVTNELNVILAVQQYNMSSISARIKSIDKAGALNAATGLNESQEDVQAPAIAQKHVASAVGSPNAIQELERNMIRIPQGTFMMGCNEAQSFDCQRNEGPVHQVEISSFRLSCYEVTQAQWAAIMGTDLNFRGSPRHPVVEVSWEKVQEFIDKLNKMTGNRYRLPTEAEWEYAARGGGTLDVSSNSSNHRFSGSNNINEVAWYIEDSEGGTHPVGTKSPNALGLYDMTGNVWEWCSDWYSNDFYTNSPKRDPQGPADGAYRVIRGGSWDLPADDCQVFNRSYNRPNYRSDNLGFRLAAP